MYEVEAQVRAELVGILAQLSDVTGLRSNWNGFLEIVPGASFKGKKPFSCGILIDEALAHQDVRWRTLIHEGLHALSVGYRRADYDDVPGWEEGVAEQLQRLLRPTILARLGVFVAEDVFQREEEDHLYNGYVAALEDLRQRLTQPAMSFYVDLLSVPIKDRPGLVLNRIVRLPRAEQPALVRAYSAANAVLKDETLWMPKSSKPDRS